VLKVERLNDIEKKEMKDFIIEQGFEGRKKGWTWEKGLVVAAAVLVIGIPVFGVTFPALAQHIPIIGGIFDRGDLHEADRYVWLSEYGIPIGETQYTEGFSITLMESFFDGERIYLAFLVEGDRDFVDEGRITFEHSHISIVFDETVITQIGSTPETYPGPDNYSQIVVLSVATPHRSLGDVDVAEVHYNISRLVGYRDRVVAHGSWGFRAPIINIGSDHIDVNQTVYYRDIEATVYHVAVSPGGMRMHFSHTEPQLGWRVMDNLGNEMLGRGGASSMVGGRTSGNISFVAPAPEATQIIIIPVARNIELPPIIIDLP